MKLNKQENYISEIKTILAQARQRAYAAVNTAMVEAYWLVGRRIVEEEQNGVERANYGAQLLKTLSQELTAEFGKGFSLTTLKNFKKFYLAFSGGGKGQTASDQSGQPKGQTFSDLLKTPVWEKSFAKLVVVERQKLFIKQQLGL